MSLTEDVYKAVAKGLRDYGYPDVTTEMIRETHAAMMEGKSGADLPHGIISMFAADRLNEAFERLGSE